VTLYASVAENVIGEDRAQMLKVWDDDEGFDNWLKQLQEKQRNPSGAKGKVPVSREAYMNKYARVYGGEEE
jgi:heme-degrading monooxygenase HmoA